MNKKGFTLAELLIVVAIIAVLVGISIPVFTAQLEKSREATDLANVRSAYAEVMVAVLSDDKEATHDKEKIYQSGVYTVDVELKQKVLDWQTTGELNIGGVSKEKDFGTFWLNTPLDLNTNVCSVTYNPEDDVVIIDWTGGKRSIEHVYEFDEGWNYDELWLGKGSVPYIVVTDEPSDDGGRRTAIQHLFDVDSNREIKFNIPDKKTASKYLDIDNFSYSIGVDFVDFNKKISLSDGRTAYLSSDEYFENTLDWGSGEISLKTNGNVSSTKAMIDVCKRDKDGNTVQFTNEEIDYIMSLLNK